MSVSVSVSMYWTDFQDDSLIFAIQMMDAQLKMKMMNLAKGYMGLTVSPKQDLGIGAEALFAGRVWTIYGMTLSQEAVDHVLGILDTRPKGIKQARMLRGVVVQARSAFEFSADELIELRATFLYISSW